VAHSALATLCEKVGFYFAIFNKLDGNFIDARAILLLQEPFNILPHLLDLLDTRTNIKVKNGALGLLKNLSHPKVNRHLLGERGVIEALAASEIWSSSNDMAEIVQGFGIGACKHLAHGDGLCFLRIETYFQLNSP
jgi:hypothetical protein